MSTLHQKCHRPHWKAFLEEQDVKIIFIPTRTIQQSLRSAKDFRLLEYTGFHSIPFSINDSMQLWRSVRWYNKKKHQQTNVRLYKKLLIRSLGEIAENILKDNEDIPFGYTNVLNQSSNYYPGFCREATEIHKRSKHFSRKELGLNLLNKTWMTVLNQIKIMTIKIGHRLTTVN